MGFALVKQKNIDIDSGNEEETTNDMSSILSNISRGKDFFAFNNSETIIDFKI